MILFLRVNDYFFFKKYYTRILKENNCDTIYRAIIGYFFKENIITQRKSKPNLCLTFFKVDTKKYH